MTSERVAVFLDRDGVLNHLVFNPNTGEFESPHTAADFRLIDGIEEPLLRLQTAGYLLFLVSNQPSYAKGKTTLENIQEIHSRLDEHLSRHGIHFSEYYYCYHHPQGKVPEYSGWCPCRKPQPYFLERAAQEHRVVLASSWFIGDQDTDMQCGASAGCRTVLLTYPHSQAKRTAGTADYVCQDLRSAADRILLAAKKGDRTEHGHANEDRDLR